MYLWINFSHLIVIIPWALKLSEYVLAYGKELPGQDVKAETKKHRCKVLFTTEEKDAQHNYLISYSKWFTFLKMNYWIIGEAESHTKSNQRM